MSAEVDTLLEAAGLMRERATERGYWRTRTERVNEQSWHLAVADLLEDGAKYLEYVEARHAAEATGDEGKFFLAVARAYLASEATP